MKHLYEQETNSLGAGDRLDQIRLSPAERRMARASMRQAELIAEMLMRANKELRQVFGFVRRCSSSLARRSKASVASPEWKLP
jgi:hypothetical protein